MQPTTAPHRQRLLQLEREELAQLQLARLNSLLAAILPRNKFYKNKLGTDQLRLNSLAELAQLPQTTKAELAAGEDYPRIANLTWPTDRYVRFHQTSGTRGRPLAVLDTAGDWKWWIDNWQYVLDAAEVEAVDRALLAFSFGPFIGFWSAHDALLARGTMVIPAGGLGTAARLALLQTSQATILLATPTYALRLLEVAGAENFPLENLSLRRIIVAGEPGGSIPAVRARIEKGLGATVIDHSGATEVGPWGFGDSSGEGLWVTETGFIAEFISVETGRPAVEGELSELVLTTLGRVGCPLLRYRTGDLVRPSWTCRGGRNFVFLQGGILGRADDMVVVRGVNIFPSSVEQILREIPEVAEYRLTVRNDEQSLAQLRLEVECPEESTRAIGQVLELRLGLKVEVCRAAVGSLPRFEAKSARFVDERR